MSKSMMRKRRSEWLLRDFATFKLGPDEDPKTGQDVTENARRAAVAEINAEPGSREALEAEYGAVYDTKELSESFTVEGFLAPYCVVRRKSDGVRGTLTFQHSPRFYFDFAADK